MRPQSSGGESTPNGVSAEAVRGQIEKILASSLFSQTPGLTRLLSHVVTETLQGRSDQLKEYSLGVDVFERGQSFEPRTDTIVRAQARRLRAKLQEFYTSEGREDPVIIELPKGSYVPVFRRREAASEETARGASMKRAAWVAAASLAVGALIYWGVSHVRRNPPAGTHSVAVLPFSDLSPARDQDYLCEGVVEAITNALSKLPSLRVVARTSAFQFKGKNEDVRTIGGKLGVGAVLEGSMQRTGERLRITVQLVSTADGYHLWSEMYDRPMNDLLAVQDDIANRVASALHVRLAGVQQSKQYDNVEAYNLYLKGRYRPRSGEAIGYFQEAIAKDPKFAPAWVGLAGTYLNLAALDQVRPRELAGKAKEAATKALEIDEKLPEAHLMLARVKAFHEWDWSGGEREFRRALELNPGDVDARVSYATHLSLMGRAEEAIEHIERIRPLDPLSPAAAGWLARIYFLARRYDRTIEHSRAAMAAFPDAWQAGEYWLGRAYSEKGMLAEAIASMERNQKMRPDRTQGFGMLAVAYARAGRKDEAARLLKEAENLAKTTYVSPVSIAQVCLALGQLDRAFQFLEQAYRDRDQGLASLKVEPAFDPLRQDPRFQGLLKRMRLVE